MADAKKEMQEKVDKEEIQFSINSDREAALERYDESQKSSDEETFTQDAKPEPEPEPDKTGEEADATDTEEKPEEETEKKPPKEEEKTIPLAEHIRQRTHLKEEKRQLTEKNRLLELQLAEADRQERPESDEELDDSDGRYTAIEKRLDAFEKRDARTQQEKVATNRNSEIGRIDTELTKQGISGFRLLFPKVVEELNEIAKTDLEFAQAHDNPEGWAKIFKERVHPEVMKAFTTDKERLSEEKRASKKEAADKAGLIGTPGSSGEKPKDGTEPKTEEERYVAAVKDMKAARVS